MFDLKGKFALVTGSTDGIGLEISKILAQCGSNIILSGSRNAENAQGTLTYFNETFPSQLFFYVQVDLSEPTNAKLLFEESLKLSDNQLTILVNNAGKQHVSPIHKFDNENWFKLMNINLNSTFILMREFIAFWKDHQEKTGQIPWGRIINISSVHGLVASVDKAAYVASKHAINGITKVAALELAEKTNITVNAVCPGYVKTELVNKQVIKIQNENGITYEEAEQSLVGGKQPSKRFTEGSAIGQYVAFLCSNFASNITGAQQVIDGAWTAQ